MNGELISGGGYGNLRRWRDWKVVEDGQPIATSQDAVLSVVELKNGEVISGDENGTLRRWSEGMAISDGNAIASGQGWPLTLIQLKNGELISGGTDGTLRRWRTTPTWQTLLPLACARLDQHLTLTRLPWFNTARATCHGLLWRHVRNASIAPNR